MKFENGWKIFTLYTSIRGTNVNGELEETTKEEYLDMISED
jgi:hypothetical protein